MAIPRLVFLRNDAGEREGLGDAGIETFRDAPYASCAREAGQNSRDAALILPIKLTFDLLRVPPEEFPDHAGLVAALEACAEEAGDQKEKEFFTNALAIGKGPELPILRVADYNTSGLIGPPDQPGTPFHSLVKSSGVSTKESETAGGSFGIGKNASFAVSDLQMVFYSTRYADPTTGQGVFAAQGKVKLISHNDEMGTPRRFTGYWGIPEGYRAVLDPDSVPGWLRRSELGTSIFCIGFRESTEWAEHMTASLISNFFCAVHREEMIFEVDGGRLRINKNTLEHLLVAGDISNAAEQSGHLADLDFAGQLYRCLVSPNAEERVIAIEGLGQVRIRILAEPGMPRRIGFIRNGMLITDNLRHFGQPMARFPGLRDFVAVVEPADRQSGALLKRLENPSHDGFSAQRIPDPVRRAAAERAMKKLGKLLREIIRSSAGIEERDAVVVDELGQFFADPSRKETPSDPSTEHDPETYVFEPPRPRPRHRPAVRTQDGEEGGRPGTGRGRRGRGGGEGPLEGNGTAGRGNHGRQPSVELEDVRNVAVGSGLDAARGRVLFFTPGASGTLRLEIQATGLNAPEALQVVGADNGTASQHGLLITAKGGERCRVRVSFDESYSGPIEVAATLVDSEEVADEDQ
jgi:hypothetical protein